MGVGAGGGVPPLLLRLAAEKGRGEGPLRFGLRCAEWSRAPGLLRGRGPIGLASALSDEDEEPLLGPPIILRSSAPRLT